MPGPIPNRDADLSRPRERRGSAGGNAGVPATKGLALPSMPYDPDPNWGDAATRLWDAAVNSGQSAFYQQTDWAVLHSLCDDLDNYKKAARRSAQMAATLYSALGSLLVTEGDRRRARIELHDPEPEQESAAVLALAEYREALGLEEDE